MMSDDDCAALSAEFDMLARRAGLHVPDDRREALFASFLEMRAALPMLREGLSEVSDTAGTFALATVTRVL